MCVQRVGAQLCVNLELKNRHGDARQIRNSHCEIRNRDDANRHHSVYSNSIINWRGSSCSGLNYTGLIRGISLLVWDQGARPSGLFGGRKEKTIPLPSYYIVPAYQHRFVLQLILCSERNETAAYGLAARVEIQKDVLIGTDSCSAWALRRHASRQPGCSFGTLHPTFQFRILPWWWFSSTCTPASSQRRGNKGIVVADCES